MGQGRSDVDYRWSGEAQGKSKLKCILSFTLVDVKLVFVKFSHFTISCLSFKLTIYRPLFPEIFHLILVSAPVSAVLGKNREI